jgi:hypothetical protein
MLGNWESWLGFWGGKRDLTFLQRAQAVSGAQPASCSMVTVDYVMNLSQCGCCMFLPVCVAIVRQLSTVKTTNTRIAMSCIPFVTKGVSSSTCTFNKYV